MNFRSDFWSDEFLVGNPVGYFIGQIFGQKVGRMNYGDENPARYWMERHGFPKRVGDIIMYKDPRDNSEALERALTMVLEDVVTRLDRIEKVLTERSEVSVNICWVTSANVEVNNPGPVDS